MKPIRTPTSHPSATCARLTERADGRFDADIAPTWTVGPKVHGGSMLARHRRGRPRTC